MAILTETDRAFFEENGYLVVPEVVLWKNDTSIPPEFLSIQEPLGNAVHATLIEPVHGKSVVILGDGPIGLFSIGVARASGATEIFLTGIEPFRLDIGKRMGAEVVVARRAISDESSREIFTSTAHIEPRSFHSHCYPGRPVPNQS